jgi:hypothetical protein
LEIYRGKKNMFVFAIETCGRTVAFTKETDRLMLEGILNGHAEEGQQLREGLAYLKAWDGVSPFTARLATESEELDYGITTEEYGLYNEVLLLTQNENNEGVLVIPPDAEYVRQLEEIEEAIQSLVKEGSVVDSGRKGRSGRTGQLETVWVLSENSRKTRQRQAA